MLRAIKDAKDGNGHQAEARNWLAGNGAHYLAETLDLDPEGLEQVLIDLPCPTQPLLFDVSNMMPIPCEGSEWGD